MIYKLFFWFVLLVLQSICDRNLLGRLPLWVTGGSRGISHTPCWDFAALPGAHTEHTVSLN